MSLLKRATPLVLWLALAVPVAGSQQAAQPVTGTVAMSNDDVIALAGAGLGDDIVIAKINAAGSTVFDTSLSGLKALKAAGVSSAVIKVMISPKPVQAAAAAAVPAGDPSDPESMHPAGVYTLVHGADGAHMTKLANVSATRVKGAPVSNFVPAGIKFVAILDGAHAAVAIQDANPTFYIYQADADATADAFVKELVIVAFEQKAKSREVVIGRSNYRTTPGVDDKAKLGCTVVRVKPGIYKVTVAKPISAGEYAFYKAATWKPGYDQDGGSFYEFGVAGKP